MPRTDPRADRSSASDSATTTPRVLVALGGNAIARPGGDDPSSQHEAIAAAMDSVAELLLEGYEVALTHGNGPQVGNLMVKNQIAREVVPPVPLHWCVAQTQATIGFLIVAELERALASRGVERPVATLVTRVLVDADDPAFEHPTKPIGRHAPESEAQVRIAEGETWEPSDSKGWRRVVPSPEPRAILDLEAVVALLGDGAVVVAAGGGGIPMIRGAHGLTGVEAVLDKDLTAGLLARAIGAGTLVIATDVPAVATGLGTPDEAWLGRVTPARLRELAARGEFGSGSMAPKVEACARFVEETDGRAVITALESLRDGANGVAGTVVESVV